MKIIFKRTDNECSPDARMEEENAFLKLYEVFKNKVYSYSLNITHSAIIAEDITQEVFMKLWLNKKSISEIINVEAWIITIARNLCFNYLKKSALEKRTSSLGVLRHSEENVENYIFYKEKLEHVVEVVNHLPKQQRIIFKLNRDEGLQNEEIASVLNISVNTVKSHFGKALRTVRQALQTYPAILISIILLLKYFF